MAIASLPKAEARNQRETGNREGCCGHEIILGSQVSAFGCLVQVFRFGYRFGRCLAQPLTANRFHLIWVGSALRADLVASGRVERPAQPRLTKGGQPYLKISYVVTRSRPYPRRHTRAARGAAATTRQTHTLAHLPACQRAPSRRLRLRAKAKNSRRRNSWPWRSGWRT
jgi:hypothetical protein